MSDTIQYDMPVKDLIAGLDATGHVTHRSYPKNSVTLHHNGGRLSHEGVLNVWKTRPASAQFDIDRAGELAQYVRVNEYAWAVGNTQGNMSSISIEMSNSTVAPTWEVLDITWMRAARLAGWLHHKYFANPTRPSANTLFYHHHWKATECAGPYMDKIYSQVLAESQKWYEHFRGVPVNPPNLTIATKAVVTAYAGRPMRITDSFYKDALQVLAWGCNLTHEPVKRYQQRLWQENMTSFKFTEAGKLYTSCLMNLMDYFGIEEDLHNVVQMLLRMKPYGYTIVNYEGEAL